MVTEKIKTGTTCIGMLFKDGVVLASDRRATAGGMISGTGFVKIFDLSSKIISTVAGHASDSQLFMRILKSELKLLELKNEREVRVKEAAMLLNSMQYSSVRNQGSIVSSILGGYDMQDGFSLFDLSPDGTIQKKKDFVVDGSGSIFIKGVVENEFKKDMSQKQALELVEKAFLTSFRNDNASGDGFIARIITKTGIEEVSRKLIESRLVNEN